MGSHGLGDNQEQGQIRNCYDDSVALTPQREYLHAMHIDKKLLRDVVLLFGLYVALGLAVQAVFGNNSTLRLPWLALGPAIYLAMIHGYRILAVSLIAAICANFLQGTGLEESFWNAFRHTATAAFGAWLYRSSGGETLTFTSVRDYLRLYGVALGMGVIAAAISYTQIGIGIRVIEVESALHRIAGTAFGFIVSMIPLLLLRGGFQSALSKRELTEGGVILGLSFIFGQAIFLNWWHDSLGQVARGYWMFLFVTLAGLRLGPKGTGIAVLIATIQAYLGSLWGLGFFSDDLAKTHLANFYFYTLCLSSDGFLVAMLFTREQQNQQVLRMREVELKEAQRIGEIGNWAWDAKSDVTTGSDQLLRIYGFDRATQTMPNFRDQRGRCYPIEDWERLNATVSKTMETGVGYELEVRAFRGGMPIWLLTRGEVVRNDRGNVVGLRGTVQDITERKRMEMNLAVLAEISHDLTNAGDERNIIEASAKKIGEYFQVEHCLFADMDRQGTTMQVLYDWRRDPTARDLTGTYRMEVFGEPGLYAKLAMGVPIVTKNVACEKNANKETFEDYGVSSGVNAPYVSNGILRASIIVNQPEVRQWRQDEVDLLQELTRRIWAGIDRCRIEASLREKDDLLSRTQQISHIGSWTMDLDSMQAQWSDETYRIFGVTPEQFHLTQETFIGLIHPDDQPAMKRWVQSCVSGQDMNELEFRVPLPDGTIRILAGRGHLEKTFDGKPYRIVGSVQNVTERNRLEEARRNSQRMEALGTLAGGIAHDFNNVLAAIRGNADLAAEDAGPNSPIAESIAEIKKACARATDLVRRIMTFGRPKTAHRDTFDLSNIVDEVLKLLRPTIPANIELRTTFSPGLPNVRADASQVHETLVNLTNNAAYAIGNRAGTIEYRTELVHPSGTAAERHGLLPGDYVAVTVKDDGVGMDLATQQRIFDAFFTTKPTGQGSGLGLSVVYGIMKAHAGAVSVESTIGVGSNIHLYFPIASEETTETVSAKEEAEKAKSISRLLRVMYVDDEEALIKLGGRVLERLGHRAATFSNTAEALQALRADPQSFDIVITDFSMPKMSGVEFTRTIRSIRADIPVIMTTGNISAENEALARSAGVSELVLKPVSMDQLSKAIARVLNS